LIDAYIIEYTPASIYLIASATGLVLFIFVTPGSQSPRYHDFLHEIDGCSLVSPLKLTSVVSPYDREAENLRSLPK